MSSDRILNIGILGFGYMGQIRKKYLDSNPNCSVTAIFHTEKLIGKFTYYDKWEDLVDDPSIDAIFVCLPNFLTKDVVIRGMQAGKHVFAEKPPGCSSTDVLEMIEVEKQTTKKLKFGFCLRYHPAIVEAKRLVDSGDFGNILWLRGRYGKSVDKDFTSSWRADRNYAGGGILLDQGMHMLDLFLMLCGDFQEVKSFVSNCYWKGDVEDNVFAILRNNDGQVASLHSTITQWRYLFSLEIFLSKGYIIVNGLLSKSGRYGKERLTWSVNRTPPPMASHHSSVETTFSTDPSWELEVHEFIGAIMNDTPILVGTTADALRVMVAVDRIYDNDKT